MRPSTIDDGTMPRRSPAPPVRLVLALVTLALVSGCGPKAREASVALLVVAGAIVVLANGIVGLLWLPWRRVRPELGFGWRPFVDAGLALSGLGLVGALLPHGDMVEWLGIALWAGGTSYLTFFLLVWRIRVPAPNALAWAHSIAGMLIFLPALAFAFFVSPEADLPDVLLWLWMLPGYAGMVAGPLFVLLWLEALVRWRATRASRGRGV